MQGQSVLVVEHDPTVQLILIDMLHHAGYDVRAAIAPNDIQLIVGWCRPAIAIISGGVRGTFDTGWQIARYVAELDPTLPLVMLTTNTSVLQEVGQTQRGKLFSAGLLKPFDLHELLARVARHMRSTEPVLNTCPACRVDSQPNHGLHQHKEHGI